MGLQDLKREHEAVIKDVKSKYEQRLSESLEAEKAIHERLVKQKHISDLQNKDLTIARTTIADLQAQLAM